MTAPRRPGPRDGSPAYRLHRRRGPLRRGLPAAATAWAIPIVGALVVGWGCGGEPPRRDCLGRVWIPTSQSEARVVGSWSGWTEPGIAPIPYDENWWAARLALPPGEYGYLVEYRGERLIDANNPLTTFAGQTEVSLLLVSDCSRPAISWDHAGATEQGDIALGGSFLTAAEGSALAPDRLEFRATVREDRGRIVLERMRRLEVLRRGEGRVWTPADGMVAKRTAIAFPRQPERCLLCPSGTLLDVNQDTPSGVRHYRRLLCLEGMEDPEVCPRWGMAVLDRYAAGELSVGGGSG